MPETYYFARGDSRASIRRMRNKMKQLLMDAWKTRSSNLPFKNSREAVILASIIEKETGMASDVLKFQGFY